MDTHTWTHTGIHTYTETHADTHTRTHARPRGSVPDPFLFSTYTYYFNDFTQSNGFKYHLYGKGSQVYIFKFKSFTSTNLSKPSTRFQPILFCECECQKKQNHCGWLCIVGIAPSLKSHFTQNQNQSLQWPARLHITHPLWPHLLLIFSCAILVTLASLLPCCSLNTWLLPLGPLYWLLLLAGPSSPRDPFA